MIWGQDVFALSRKFHTIYGFNTNCEIQRLTKTYKTRKPRGLFEYLELLFEKKKQISKSFIDKLIEICYFKCFLILFLDLEKVINLKTINNWVRLFYKKVHTLMK